MTVGRKRRDLMPFHDWPLWKVVVLYLPFTAVWCAFPLIVPPYVPRWAIAASASLFAVTFGSVLWLRFRDNPWGRGVLHFAMVPAMFGLVAVRAWMVALPDDREWTLVFLGAGMAAAAVLPFVAPRLSDFLWQEQTVPRTRIGRAFFALCLAIAPSAGVMGASYGMWTHRWYGIEAAMLLGAILASIIAVGLAFVPPYHVTQWLKKGLVEF